jgi:hypothetical protein
MVEVLELDDDYGIFDWPDAIKVFHHGDYSMETRRYTYRKKGEADLQAENDKLRALVRRMAYALDVGTEWCYQHCCAAFKCDMVDCPIAKVMNELGIEVE